MATSLEKIIKLSVQVVEAKGSQLKKLVGNLEALQAVGSRATSTSNSIKEIAAG